MRGLAVQQRRGKEKEKRKEDMEWQTLTFGTSLLSIDFVIISLILGKLEPRPQRILLIQFSASAVIHIRQHSNPRSVCYQSGGEASVSNDESINVTVWLTMIRSRTYDEVELTRREGWVFWTLGLYVVPLSPVVWTPFLLTISDFFASANSFQALTAVHLVICYPTSLERNIGGCEIRYERTL